MLLLTNIIINFIKNDHKFKIAFDRLNLSQSEIHKNYIEIVNYFL